MVARDRMLDNGLLALTTESDRVFLCATDPATYTDANTTHVAQKNGSRGSMFLALSPAPLGGRKASLSGFSDGDITSNGTANFVVVADSVLQNILISELLVDAQPVVSGGKFGISTFDVIIGSTSQPQAANLTVASPVIGVPVFFSSQPAATPLVVGSPIIGTPTMISTAAGWTNIPEPLQLGGFTFEFDAVPNALALDNVIGLSNGPALAFTDVACAINFSVASTITVRNGSTYQALNSVSYTAGAQFHLRMFGNITAHTYSVWVTPQSTGIEVQLANNYAFRTEQAAVTQLNNFARNATDIGVVAVSNMVFGGLTANSLTVGSPVISSAVINGKVILAANALTTTSPSIGVGAFKQVHRLVMVNIIVGSPVFTSPSLIINTGQPAGAFASQTGDFIIAWDAVPTLSAENAVCGLSFNAPVDFTSFACAIRFFTAGNIDVRNGGTYGASTTVPYSAGLSYHFRLNVRISNHTYDVFVTPQGQSEVTLANNFAFRSDQASITTINFLGKVLTTGDINLANRTGPTPIQLPPVVIDTSFPLTTTGAGWTAGATVGVVTATNTPTSWSITAGNGSGFFAIASNGTITVTSAGISGLGGQTGTINLTVQATNAFGNDTGAVTINYTSAASATIPFSKASSLFAGNVNGGSIPNTGTLSNRTWDDSPGYSSGDALTGWAPFTTIGTVTVSKCIMDGREGPRLTGGSTSAATIIFDQCYIHCVGVGADHADAFQAFANQGNDGNGTVTIKNSYIRAYTVSEAVQVFGSGFVESTSFLWGDGWKGNVTFDNVIFHGSYRILIAADTGTTNVSFRNCHFVNHGAIDLIFAGGTLNLLEWTNCRDSTISNGAIVPGPLRSAPVPRPPP